MIERDFRCLDQPHSGQDFGNRARTDAHRRRQTALGLARLFQSPLDQFDVQHASSFPNFRNYSNSDYQKSSLTSISEYQKLHGCRGRRQEQVKAWNRRTGRPRIRTRCGSTLPWACPMPRSRGRSTRNSTRAIRAVPRSAAPDALDLERPIRRPKRQRRRRYRHRCRGHDRKVCRNWQIVIKPWPNGSCRFSNRLMRRNCVPSMPIRFICRCLALGAGDCRYPYGGDEEGEAITFCGHPKYGSSSYCAAHFHLTRRPDAMPQSSVSAAALRVVEAA